MPPQSYWDKAYKIGETPWREPVEISELLNKSGVSSGNVLDLGCGTGEWAIEFDRAGFAVEGIDFSRHALDIAMAEKSKVTWVEWDLENLSDYVFKSEKYNLILDHKVLAFIVDKEKYLNTVKQKLGGVYVLTVFHEHESSGICVSQTDFDRLVRPRFIIHYSKVHKPRPGKVFATYYLR